MKVEFEIKGKPLGKMRHKNCRIGNFSRSYNPEFNVTYENLVKILYQEASTHYFAGGIRLELKVFFDIPKSTSKKKRELMLSGEILPLKKPDFDNVEKIITDALNKIAYNDDCQICSNGGDRFYAEEPRVIVSLEDIKDYRERIKKNE